MAGSDKTWVDNNPPQLAAADLNGFKNEQNNLIAGSGQAIDTGDLQQQHKSVSQYSIVGDYYTDTGSANAYSVTPPTPRVASPSLKDAMKVRALIANTNTGASTFDYAGIGAKSLKLKGNLPLPAGSVIAGQIGIFEYNLSGDIWILEGVESLDLKTETLAFTFASDANDTLTAIENLYGKINITGAVLTAARNLTVSNSQRILFVTNGEGFAVTVKTASGTGISVPSGSSALLLCDGVNVIDPTEITDLFTRSQTTNGYQKLPGGIIVQWGQGNTVGSGATAISYPIAFPNNVYSISGAGNVGGGTTYALGLTMSSLSQFSASLRDNAGTYYAQAFSWIAIGN